MAGTAASKMFQALQLSSVKPELPSLGRPSPAGGGGEGEGEERREEEVVVQIRTLRQCGREKGGARMVQSVDGHNCLHTPTVTTIARAFNRSGLLCQALREEDC